MGDRFLQEAAEEAPCDLNHCHLCDESLAMRNTIVHGYTQLRGLSEAAEITAWVSMMTITPSMEEFIASWGDMASRWCVNRTVAEVHALFYLSPEPLSAEDVAVALSFSRSNVSASLRELERRGLINPVHVRGDRKQFYEAKKDLPEAFRLILDDHKRRVIDPCIAEFRACLEEQIRTAPEDSFTAERMREVVTFFEGINPLYNELRRLPNGPIQNLFKVTAKIRELLG